MKRFGWFRSHRVGCRHQEVRVEMQNGRTSVIRMGPREMTGYDNARAMSGVPSTNGYVTVQMREERGRADVVEQPTAQNGYTTVVRIRDTQSGELTWHAWPISLNRMPESHAGMVRYRTNGSRFQALRFPEANPRRHGIRLERGMYWQVLDFEAVHPIYEVDPK